MVVSFNLSADEVARKCRLKMTGPEIDAWVVTREGPWCGGHNVGGRGSLMQQQAFRDGRFVA
jgi:hypothetical protein